MFDGRLIQINALICGSFFSLFAAISLMLTKQFNKEKRRILVWMQFSTSVLLAGDSLSYIFKGYPGVYGYFMMRIGSFLCFFATDLLLLFFHGYVCSYAFAGKTIKKAFRVYAGFLSGSIGMGLVVISQFTHLYYSFDAYNVYHRENGYVISMIIPFLVMGLDFSILIQCRKKINRRIFFSMILCILLPVLTMFIQFFFYGWAFVNIMIGLSMLVLFLVAMSEQNREMIVLTQKNSEVSAKLEIATTLNSCVRELSAVTDTQTAIHNLLHVINDYFRADHTYIYEIDYGKKVAVNTHIYMKNGLSKQSADLQDMQLDRMEPWLHRLQKGVCYISNLEQNQMDEFKEILRKRNVDSILAVILQEGEKLIGIMGVDNPRKHYHDETLLSSIRYFIINSLSMKKKQEWMEYLSYRDIMTKLYNRNKYIETVEHYVNKALEFIGVVYIDLNNLKKFNDQQGHEAGDRYIRRAAAVLGEIFPQNAYRVGGDEFVVLLFPVEKEIFYQKIEQLQKDMQEKQVSISLGVLWEEKTNDLESLLKKADKLMYQEKERYHQQRR